MIKQQKQHYEGQSVTGTFSYKLDDFIEAKFYGMHSVAGGILCFLHFWAQNGKFWCILENNFIAVELSVLHT